MGFMGGCDEFNNLKDQLLEVRGDSSIPAVESMLKAILCLLLQLMVDCVGSARIHRLRKFPRALNLNASALSVPKRNNICLDVVVPSPIVVERNWALFA